MTKDPALLIGPKQSWLSTRGFMDKLEEFLQKAMGETRVAGGRPRAIRYHPTD